MADHHGAVPSAARSMLLGVVSLMGDCVVCGMRADYRVARVAVKDESFNPVGVQYTLYCDMHLPGDAWCMFDHGSPGPIASL